MDKVKLKPGDTCIFDPYNILHQKETYNDVVCVRVLKVHKSIFGPTTVDLFSINTNQTLMNIPTKVLYKVDNFLEPIVLVRYPPNIPLIDNTDIKLIDYCISEIKDPVVNKLLKNFREKLDIYQLSSFFTNGD